MSSPCLSHVFRSRSLCSAGGTNAWNLTHPQEPIQVGDRLLALFDREHHRQEVNCDTLEAVFRLTLNPVRVVWGKGDAWISHPSFPLEARERAVKAAEKKAQGSPEEKIIELQEQLLQMQQLMQQQAVQHLQQMRDQQQTF